MLICELSQKLELDAHPKVSGSKLMSSTSLNIVYTETERITQFRHTRHFDTRVMPPKSMDHEYLYMFQHDDII